MIFPGRKQHPSTAFILRCWFEMFPEASYSKPVQQNRFSRKDCPLDMLFPECLNAVEGNAVSFVMGATESSGAMKFGGETAVQYKIDFTLKLLSPGIFETKESIRLKSGHAARKPESSAFNDLRRFADAEQILIAELS